ncbi:MAG: hypothetical protein ACLFVC_01915 [Opitutales bacterium]
MGRMKIFLGMACCLLPGGSGLFGAVFECLRGDDLPFDYGSMDVRRGVEDAEVNGYTALRELAQEREIELGDDFEGLYGAPRGNREVDAMAGLVDRHAWVFEGVEAAFDKPEFYFDQANTPETLIPEVGFFRRYVQLAVLQVRVDLARDEDLQALERLLALESQIGVYSQSGGGLISLLTAVACYGILQEELTAFLAEARLEPEVFAAAGKQLEFHRGLPRAVQTAMRHEFHFSKYCIRMMEKDPHGLLNDISDLIGGGAGEGSEFEKQMYEWVVGIAFKPVRTTNRIYRAYAEMIEEADRPAAQREFKVWRELMADLEDQSRRRLLSRNAVGRMLLKILVPAVEPVMDHVDRTHASGAAMQAMFALRAHFGETGELPETLDQLVPEYFGAIPEDPFDGKPIRYSKAKAIVYSVGKDLLDSGGSAQPFRHELEVDDERDPAERDLSEPTFPLRFAW